MDKISIGKRCFTVSLVVALFLSFHTNAEANRKKKKIVKHCYRIYEKGDKLKRNHAEISAEMSKEFLFSKGFSLVKDDINNIIHSIRAHSFSNEIIARTLEAKILSDADKLDALGAIGIFRTIGFTLENKGGIIQIIEHLENKILKLKNQMSLEYSKSISKDRHNSVLEFYNKLKKERV